MANIGIIKKPRYNDELISRVALNCHDISFFEFKSDIYGEAVYRAQKKIAERYSVLDRQIVITADSETDPILIPITDLQGVSEVVVEGYRLKRRSESTDELRKQVWEEATYDITFSDDQQWYIQYQNPLAADATTPQVIGDEITIKYNSIGNDPNTDTGEIILPEKYIEEVVRIATLAIARWGIAKFREEKREKYIVIVRTYERKSARDDQNLEKSVSWIHVKPFQYP